LDLFFGSALVAALIALMGSYFGYRRSVNIGDPILRTRKRRTFEVSFYWTVLAMCVMILWNFSKRRFPVLAGL